MGMFLYRPLCQAISLNVSEVFCIYGRLHYKEDMVAAKKGLLDAKLTTKI